MHRRKRSLKSEHGLIRLEACEAGKQAAISNEKNLIPASQQNTPDIEGYYYTANDRSQMAFWIYKADRVSKEHTHDYDEWMLCVEGEYIVTVDGAEYILHAGDELFIPKGSV